MAGTNWALVSAGASAITAPSGVPGTADSAAIDGDDTTGKGMTGGLTWNYLVTLASPKLIDAVRVLFSVSAVFRVQQCADPNNSATWVTIASGRATDTGLIPLSQPVSSTLFNVSIDVPGSGGTLFTFELWSGTQPPPTSTADVNNALAAWLSHTDNTHADSEPVRNNAQLTDANHGLAALKTLIDAVKTGVDNVPKAGDSDWTVVSKLWQIAGALTDAEIAAWNLFAKRAPSQLTGGSGGGGSAFTALSDDMAAISSQIVGLGLDSLRGIPVFPGGSWSQIDAVDFTRDKSWAVAADLYVLGVSNIPAYINSNDVDGAIWRPRLGWWAVRNGDHFGDRRFVNWANSHLQDGGRRMPGIVVRTAPGCDCHLEAWQLV